MFGCLHVTKSLEMQSADAKYRQRVRDNSWTREKTVRADAEERDALGIGMKVGLQLLSIYVINTL